MLARFDVVDLSAPMSSSLFPAKNLPAMTDSLTFSSPSDEKREGEVREHSANNCFSSIRRAKNRENAKLPFFPPKKNSFSSFLITHSPCSLSSLAFRGGEEFPSLYPHREFFAATYSMLLPDNESFEVGGILASSCTRVCDHMITFALLPPSIPSPPQKRRERKRSVSNPQILRLPPPQKMTEGSNQICSSCLSVPLP